LPKCGDSRLVDGCQPRAEQSISALASISVDDLLDGRCDAWDAFAAERHVLIQSSVRRGQFVRATPGRLEQVYGAPMADEQHDGYYAVRVVGR
jgi:hypothetical protein